MAELTVTTFLTLDGVMQAPGGPGEDPSGGFGHEGWLVPHADEDMGRTMAEIFSKASAFLLGRTTYDIFAGHWPKVTDPSDPIAAPLNALPKFVASSTRSAGDWGPTQWVRDVVAEVPSLKARFDGEVQVHGSAGLAQTLIAHDLVDEYRLLTFPVVVGHGKRLFGAGTAPSTLKLVHAARTGGGAVLAVYRRGGPLCTGSFGLEYEA
jgi:dihydrofolate reductase